MKKNLKKLITLGLIVVMGMGYTASPVQARQNTRIEDLIINEENFPDEVFRNYVITTFDTDKNGNLSQSEIEKITYIDLIDESELTSLQGIEYFSNLEAIYADSKKLQSIDVSKNEKISNLSLSYTSLTSIDVSHNPKLSVLTLANTDIAALDLSENINLKENLNIMGTPIKYLDLRNNTQLKNFFPGSSLQVVEIGNNPNIIIHSPGLNTSYSYIDVYGSSFDITQVIPNINPSQVTITSGGELKGSIVSGYQAGVPITYEYNCGTSKDGPIKLKVKLTVTIHKVDSILNFTTESMDKKYDGKAVMEPSVTKTGSSKDVAFTWYEKNGVNWTKLSSSPVNAGKYKVVANVDGDDFYNGTSVEKEFTINKADTTIAITTDNMDKVYDGVAVSEPEVNKTGSTHDVTFTWYVKDSENWKEISSAPTDTGSYKVIANVKADDNYNEAKAEKEFSISQTTNEWIEGLSITGWTYGEQANEPTANAKFGTATFSYSDKEDGTYTDTSPTDAGTWYVKATVAGNENYTGLEAIKEFTISKADSSIAFKDGFSLDKTYDTKAVVISKDELEMTGSTGNIAFKYEKKVDDTWETLQEAPTGAGIYRVTATLEADNNYNSATSQSLEFTISKADTLLEFMVNDLDKIYDGKAMIAPTKQSGNSHVRVLSWYQLGEDGKWIKLEKAPVNAGSYKVVASVEPDNNYNGTQIEMNFEITKAVPTYTLPTDLMIKQGDALSTLKLPDGWTWNDETLLANTLGTHEFKATFTPEDTLNYKNVETDIMVEVVPAISTINLIPEIIAEDKVLTVGETLNVLVGVTAFDKEDGNLTDQIKVIENNVDTSKAGVYKIVYKVTDSQGASVTKTIKVTVKEKEVTQITDQNSNEKNDTINQNHNEQGVVETGDSTHLYLWMTISLFSIIGMLLTSLFKRNQQQ